MWQRLFGGSSDAEAALQQEVEAISRRAFALAIRRFQAGAASADTEADADALQDELDAAVARLQEKYPRLLERLSGELSEATLDLRYARQGGAVTSLRLNRFIGDTGGEDG